MSLDARRAGAMAAIIAALLLVHGLSGPFDSLHSLRAGQIPAPQPLTVLAKEGRRTIQLSLVGDQEFVALDDLASNFQLAVREDTLGALTVAYKGRTIVLTTDQALASVAGKLISLPAAPARSGRGGRGAQDNRWLVPVEFISRALAPIYDTRLDLRKPAHLLVVGDLRVPHLAIRFEPSTASARLTIDALPRTAATVAQENDRLAIRFEADALDVTLPLVPPQPLVAGLRIADPAVLSVDLGPRFGGFRASTQAFEGSSRLIVDLASVQTETPPPAPGNPPPAGADTMAPRTPTPPPPDLTALLPPTTGGGVRTMAIDPGHGGDDQGAVGPGGTKEKDLTLAVARRLKAVVESRLGMRVVLTRDDDHGMPIDDRTAAANNNKADVFVSLHASASLRPGTNGATIFYAALESETEEAAQSRTTERLPTFSGGTREIELVPWDQAQVRYVDRSLRFARILEQQFRGRVPLSRHAVDRAPLRILESANMPAVVIEIGYLSSADQEKQLSGGDFQAAFVQALVDALVRFRDEAAP